MAVVPMASRQNEVEMFQKGHFQSIFVGTSSLRPKSEMEDTDFEEDMSDFDDYAGRRSEESFGKRSETTVSTIEELQTPASNDFGGFNFQLQIQDQDKYTPAKPVEGPVGPHLFRISPDPTEEDQYFLQWSSADSPQRQRAGPIDHQTEQKVQEAPSSSVPLECWSSQHVAAWMKDTGFEDSAIEKFCANDITGEILRALQFADLKELGIMSFGQRHHLWNEIRNLRGSISIPSTPAGEGCSSPNMAAASQTTNKKRRGKECSAPTSPEEGSGKSHTVGRRRVQRPLRSDDVISPAESASIVGIEYILPKEHHCSMGQECPKWQKRERKMARLKKQYPELSELINEVEPSPSELTVRPTSEAVPSVVASSDLLGPGRLPAMRLDEDVLRVVPPRDPQENVRQFLTFQHLDQQSEEPGTPPYEMFPPLSPPRHTQAPHSNLSNLPKLTIPAAPPDEIYSPSRTAIRHSRTPVTAMPVTAMDIRNHTNNYDIFRLGSPASAMDVPTTAVPVGPIARDESQSVPPDMRFGAQPISRSTSRAGHRQLFSPISRPRTTNPIERSASHASRRPQQNYSMQPVEESRLSPIDGMDELTPTVSDVNHAGWMKKRKTKMLRHEWHEHHFRLNGTRLAMHRDSKALEALDYIDVDEYAVACSSLASNKLNAAFKSLKLSSKKKEGDVSAFSFQLVPAAEKKGILSAATGKTHHFAVKTRDERIDWMRELMLAKALRQKYDGCEINVNGSNMI